MSEKTNTKENIINAWLAVERLSEGDFDKNTAKDVSEEENPHKFVSELLNRAEAEARKKDKPGIILYGGIFPSSDVVDILRDRYRLKPTAEDISSGESKFSFALVFDRELKLYPDKTFITVSSYIRQYKKFPTEKEFTEFERKQKESLCKEIEDGVDRTNGYGMRDKDKEDFGFQLAVLNLKRAAGGSLFVRAVRNIETDSANMHSFFVQDLEYAKHHSSQNTDKYVLGESPAHIDLNPKDHSKVQKAQADTLEGAARVNLNTRKESADFNPAAIEEILQPENYPLSRFPSELRFAPSLMQQIAINLAVGFDDNNMRSVNGPPGTGKSTLLRDIFAELITKQALAITKLSDKRMRGDDSTVYYGTAKIGILPKEITDNGIVVASSNNGAVQNIVSELPEINKIDEAFRDELLKVDYFAGIANGENEYRESDEDEDRELSVWGLFSMEGGAKKKFSALIYTLKAVFDNLNDGGYKQDVNAYADFRKKYDKVYRYRAQIQNYAENTKRLSELEPEADDVYWNKKNLTSEIVNVEDKKRKVHEKVEALKLQKPWLYIEPLSGFISSWQNYREKSIAFSDELLTLISKEEELNDRINKLSEKLNVLQEEIKNIKNAIKPFDSVRDIELLDLTADYDTLQKSSPWFGREYRIMQSELFIAALRVRKQFLFENKSHVNAAFRTWQHLDDGDASERAVEEAWNWTNFVVPVIGTTFASVRNMFSHIRSESIGHLFIDEAGQALPWASVGAISRSRHVMAVGDPSQILPILSVDSNILKFLRELYGVSRKYLSAESSTQTFLDDVSKYGFYKDGEKEEWIGIPLWVHRRCASPMFDIANAISYDGNMTQGNPKIGVAKWLDIPGAASDKYVKEQGEAVKQYLQEHPDKFDTTYVISPFKNVAYRLSEVLKEIGFTKYNEQGKPINVGTVHTFQGKENDVVFLVLGADENSTGAAAWAMGEKNPNIMNVAATRAKKEFYIVGDKKLYLSLNSSVINKTCKILQRFNNS